MLKYNLLDISKYRSQLMGIATLLILFGHSAGNGVLMPRWMVSLCGIASVGVDIFLLTSGFGLYFSLNSLYKDHNGDLRLWYKRRYKRLLIPYVIIIGISCFFSLLSGGYNSGVA